MTAVYQVTPEIEARAARLGIKVTPSKRKDKKLDAYDLKSNTFIASFGGRNYMDFHQYKELYGDAVAIAKRTAYRARHAKDRVIKYRDGKLTAGYLADRILW